MKRLLLFVLLCIGGTCYAQKEMDIQAHKPIGYLGAGLSRPMFIGKDFEPIDLWQSVHLKQGLFFMDFRWGRHIMKNADSTAFIGKGFILNWGMRFSDPSTNKHGRLTVGSFAIRPKFDFGISFASMPIDSVTRGFGDGPMSMGVHMSPGVIFRGSSVYIIASLETDAMMSVQPFGPERKTFNLGRGLIIAPSISIGFDNGWELLSPRKRHREGTYKYTEWTTTGYTWTTTYNPSMDRYEEWRVERGYSTEKLGFYSYTINKIDAFWGIGPSYSFYTHNNYGATNMFGAMIGMRFSFIKINAQYLTGQKGTGNGIPDSKAQFTRYNNQTINYTASIKASEISVCGGINLISLCFGRNNSIFHDQRNKATGSCFYSFVLYYKYGQMTFSGAPSYTFAGAENALDTLFASSNDIERSVATDARLIPSSSIMQGLGLSLEFGMVSLSAEKMKYTSAPIANGWNVNLAVMIPVYKAVQFTSLWRKTRKGEIKQK